MRGSAGLRPPTQAPEMREALLCSEGFLATEELRLELAMFYVLAYSENSRLLPSSQGP